MFSPLKTGGWKQKKISAAGYLSFIKRLRLSIQALASQVFRQTSLTLDMDSI